MPLEETSFVLPDLLNDLPHKLIHNPHYEVVSAESALWVESYSPFDEKTQNFFNRCTFGLFASWAYPHASASHFRSACDLINYYFVFDHMSDGKDAQTVKPIAVDYRYVFDLFSGQETG